MLPLEIIQHIRTFADIDTKIAMYRAGIPMSKIHSQPIPAPLAAELNIVGEPYIQIQIQDTNKIFMITKGNITPYLVDLWSPGESNAVQCLGFFDTQKQGYFFVDVVFGP